MTIVVRMLRSKTAARMNGYNGFGACGSGIGPSEGVSHMRQLFKLNLSKLDQSKGAVWGLRFVCVYTVILVYEITVLFMIASIEEVTERGLVALSH